jgi:plasmid stabilization system protein ParE
MKIIWTIPAVSDLESIRDYIARDSEFYAARMVAKIMERVKSAAKSPLLGQVVTEFNDNSIRERYVQKYRLVYRVKPDSIVVLAIIHGARDAGAINLDRE